jgi:hypothetical protein
MCAEIAPIEKQDKILEKMLILKYRLFDKKRLNP